MVLNKTIKAILTAAGIVAGLFLFPFLLRTFAPFIAAFVVATPCQRIVGRLEKKYHLSRSITSALISTLIVGLATFLVIFLSFRLYTQTKNLVVTLPAAIDSFRGQLGRISQTFSLYRGGLPEDLNHLLDKITVNLKDYAMTLSERAAGYALSAAGNFAAKLPGIALFLTMFILGTFFFTKDYVLVANFLKELLPKKATIYLARVKRFTTAAFSSYLKAQLILMALTSALVTVCLWIIGKDYPLLWGIICGAIDALPFFGTAVVLLPWALGALMFGDWYTFVALLVIQALVFLVRQLAEPKVISRQIGIHPILTLVGVYIGLKFFGVLGVVFAPILMVLVVNLYVSWRESRQ